MLGAFDEFGCEHIHALCCHLLGLVAQFAVFGNCTLHGLDYVGRIVEHFGDFIQRFFEVGDGVLNICACDSLDTADSGCDAAFRDDFYHTDVAGVIHVGSTTQLHRIAIFNHAHIVAIFLAKKSHCSHFLRFCYGHIAIFLAGDCHAHMLVGEHLHLLDFFFGEFLEVREVEAEDICRHETTFLLNVCSEHFAQSLVEEVSGGVVAGDSLAHVGVDGCLECNRNICGEFLGEVNGEVVFALGVVDFNYLVAIFQHTFVAHLTAHFGVEWRL